MKQCMDKDNLPMTLIAEDVQSILRISRARAYQVMHSDGFPLITVGKRMLCLREDFFAWLEEQTGKVG